MKGMKWFAKLLMMPVVVALLVVPLGGALSATTGSAGATGPIGYSVRSDVDGHLYKIDLSTGAATDLGPVGLWDAQGLASVGKTLYAIGGTVNEFWNITAPPGFKVGDTGSRSGIDAGLAYDPTSAKMYNIQRCDSYLYEINIATGAATYVGYDSKACPDGLAIDSSGVAYAVDGLQKDALYTVDLSTGALTLVGPLGVDLWAEVGLAFDPASGALYLLTDRGEIYTVDRSTGSATFVANTLGGFEGLAIVTVAVPVDIKPQSCPNPLNVKSKGVLPAAILGTADFDVSQVDPATVQLESVSALRWAIEDVATPFEPFIGKEGCDACTTEGPDGFMDLTLQFDTQAIVAALGDVSDGQCLVLHLTGNLKEEFGGTPIVGENVVWILKKGE